jgi:hypothetical protein
MLGRNPAETLQIYYWTQQNPVQSSCDKMPNGMAMAGTGRRFGTLPFLILFAFVTGCGRAPVSKQALLGKYSMVVNGSTYSIELKSDQYIHSVTLNGKQTSQAGTWTIEDIRSRQVILGDFVNFQGEGIYGKKVDYCLLIGTNWGKSALITNDDTGTGFFKE